MGAIEEMLYLRAGPPRAGLVPVKKLFGSSRKGGRAKDLYAKSETLSTAE